MNRFHYAPFLTYSALLWGASVVLLRNPHLAFWHIALLLLLLLFLLRADACSPPVPLSPKRTKKKPRASHRWTPFFWKKDTHL